MSGFWQDRRVLVTGATGLVGSWLVPALLARGAVPVAVIRGRPPGSMLVRDGWLDRIDTVDGRFDDEELLRTTIARFGVRTIFHLAAQTLVEVAKADPGRTLDINVRGTWTVLEAARKSSGVQVVVSSSDKAYGPTDQLPYLETHPLRGRFPYDVSKSCADLIARMYGVTYDMPVGITRCGNLFGGGDMNFSRTVPGLIRSALRGEPFRIRSDGKFVRDFLYVEDAVDGHLLLAERLEDDASLRGEAFNLSLGRGYTVLDIVDTTLGLMDKTHIRPVVLNEASAEIREQFMVSDKARDRLGWVPRIGLEEGLRRTINWYTDVLGAGLEDSTGG